MVVEGEVRLCGVRILSGGSNSGDITGRIEKNEKDKAIGVAAKGIRRSRYQIFLARYD